MTVDELEFSNSVFTEQVTYQGGSLEKKIKEPVEILETSNCRYMSLSPCVQTCYKISFSQFIVTVCNTSCQKISRVS